MATILRKCLLMAFAMLTTTGLFAQSDKQAINILDKTASIIGHKGGASADFTFQNAKVGTTSGSIAIKGNRFNATTPAATVWFDGKAQWTYMQKTQEVNITTPTQAQQMQMNPYTFTHIYKTGYTTTMTTSGQSYEIHLVAQNKKRTIQEMYITVDKKTYVPSRIKMRQNSTWSTITVKNFKAKNLSNATFTFNSKDFPHAEIVDLR